MKKITINADKHLIKELQKKLQELSEQLSDLKKTSDHFESEYLRLRKEHRTLNAKLYNATDLLKDSLKTIDEKTEFIKELCTFIWGSNMEQSIQTRREINAFILRREDEKREGKSESVDDKERVIDKDIIGVPNRWRPIL